MPITPTYPGIYIEEIPSGVRTITGVSTSVTAFIGYFKRGPMNKAVRIFNMGDFEREFGGLEAKSEASYAIRQFFLNGGSEAWVVRVASEKPVPPVRAEVSISHTSPAGAPVLTVKAINEGTWGNWLRVRVDNSGLEPEEFNLTIAEVTKVNDQTVPVQPPEIFRNLSMVSTQTNFVKTVINDPNTGSKLVRVEANGTTPPLMNGTLSEQHDSASEVMVNIPESPAMMVAISKNPNPTDSEYKLARMGFPPSITLPSILPLRTVAPVLQSAIQAAAPDNPAFAAATVEVIDSKNGGQASQKLRILAGPGDPSNRVKFKFYIGNTTATNLQLTNAALITATLSGELDLTRVLPINANSKVRVKVDTNTVVDLTLTTAVVAGSELKDVASSLQQAFTQSSNTNIKSSFVTVLGQRLVILPGSSGKKFEFEEIQGGGTTDQTASKLKLLTTTEAINKTVNLSKQQAGNPTIPVSPEVSVTGKVTHEISLPPLTNGQKSLTEVASALQSAIQSKGTPKNNTVLQSSKVFVVGKRLVILPGGNTTAAEITFNNITTPQDKTADILLLTSSLTFSKKAIKVTATRSGQHSNRNKVTFSAAPVIDVRFGAISRTATLNLSKDEEFTLATVASSLQEAIRNAEPKLTAFSESTVSVIDNKLVVLPGGRSPAAMTFADVSLENGAAKTMKLDDQASRVTATLSGAHESDPILPTNPDVKVIVEISHTASLNFEPASLPAPQSLATIAEKLQNGIKQASSNNVFTDAQVTVVDNRLAIFPGGNTGYEFSFANAGASDVAKNLKLTTTVNVQEYTLGKEEPPLQSAQMKGKAGNDGTPPDGTALIGEKSSKKGIYALEEVDILNLLCIPRAACIEPGSLSPPEAHSVLSVAEQYCAKRRAFFLMDTPTGIDNLQEIEQMLPNLPRNKNAALYYPRVQIPDPLNNFRLRSVGASGTIAGLFARTDSGRGVWKAPAGTDATLENVSKLDDVLSDAENGVLNKLGVNCLRTFPVYGTICWGARTLDGADQKASEWKYVPVRRLALFIEQTLYRSFGWVVFEPNDESLWANIRLNINTFMSSLFSQGAFQGSNSDQAFQVKCDSTTTRQEDINLGIVNIIVAFAPLKPAEFVIVKIAQLAGQTQV